MEEPWDEMMGPSDEQLKKMLNQPKQDPIPLRRTISAPTPDMLDPLTPGASDMGDASVPPPNPKSSSIAAAVVTPETTPRFDKYAHIREEALKVLEVADEQLADDTFSVRRTLSGSISASSSPMGKKKRFPTALSALNFTANRVDTRSNDTRSNKYEEHFALNEGAPKARGSYEYGENEEDDIADVAGMEKRALASRPAAMEPPAASWSSRYSVDSTLLALTGGAASNKTVLEDLEKDAERNLYKTSSSTAPQIFGSGFNFRQKYVYGKQKATVKTPTNLRTAYRDSDEGDHANAASISKTSPTRKRSWQRHLEMSRKQRFFFVAAGVILILFALVMIAMGAAEQRGSNPVHQASDNNIISMPDNEDSESVTFYVASNMPADESTRDRMPDALKVMSTQAAFLTHLGNIQSAEETGCEKWMYEEVASMLKYSPIPTFLIPGEEDWNNCPDPDYGWQNWWENFRFFHANFNFSDTVQSQKDRYENFGFQHSGVLFVGVHVVGGEINDIEETAERNFDNFNWVKAMLAYHGETSRAVVIFGNAHPGLPQNNKFFRDVAGFLQTWELPAVYIHADSGNEMGTMEYNPFESEDAEDFVAIEVKGGEPVRVTVGYGDRPFIIG